MEIMADRELDRLQVSDLVKVKQAEVDYWLLSHESRNHKDIPDMAIELLELKLGLKELK